MQHARTSRRAGARLFAVRAMAVLAALTVAACEHGTEVASGPSVPGNAPDNPALTRAAFVFYVNTQTHQVSISAPSATVNAASAIAPKSAISTSIVGPRFSLIAGDAITLTASNYHASNVGDFITGKIRVQFDLSITNKLSSVQLITPTFPTPPPGVSGVLMFPFATHVTVTSGGVSVGGSGDSLIVELPNRGEVAPSVDWDGTPFNFFNDADCPAGSNDCYRYETYTAPIAPGATTVSRTVGFDIDPTVANFSAKIIVAADLQNSGPAPTGTISGTVTSPQRGALSGVTVTANVGGFNSTTNGTGNYTLNNVTTGPKTVSLSGLPAGCTDPGSQATTVTTGNTSTVNFSVTCTMLTGSVSGTITRTGTATPDFGGTIVTATPAASGTSPSSVTIAVGSLTYSNSNVQIGLGTGAGNGSVALSNLPAGCTTAAGSYTGLTAGGTATVNFTVNCVPPPAFYQYNAVWGTITGGTVTLTLSFDPSTLNDPAVNGTGADDFNTFQATVTYPTGRLTFSSCANGAGSPFSNINANSTTAGSFSMLNFKNGAGSTTAQVVAVCTFTVGAGTTQTATTNTSLEVISSGGGNNLIPNTQKHEGTLSIP
ncbi:MAG TPA: hypothetical protein VLT79_02370 [Gemmatimonadales bacterium]|nr:hypothetical protein [Gemmatimonadales bacterium]